MSYSGLYQPAQPSPPCLAAKRRSRTNQQQNKTEPKSLESRERSVHADVGGRQVDDALLGYQLGSSCAVAHYHQQTLETSTRCETCYIPACHALPSSPGPQWAPSFLEAPHEGHPSIRVVRVLLLVLLPTASEVSRGARSLL